MQNIQTVVVSGLLVLFATLVGYMAQHLLQRNREKTIRGLEQRARVYGNLSSKTLLLINEVQEFYVNSDGLEVRITDSDKIDPEFDAKGVGVYFRLPDDIEHRERLKLLNDVQMAIGESMLFANDLLKAKLEELEDYLYSKEFQVNWKEMDFDHLPFNATVSIWSVSGTYRDVRRLWEEMLSLMRGEIDF